MKLEICLKGIRVPNTDDYDHEHRTTLCNENITEAELQRLAMRRCLKIPATRFTGQTLFAGGSPYSYRVERGGRGGDSRGKGDNRGN